VGIRGILFRVVAVLLAVVAGLYGFELAFRQLFLVNAVPRTEREFDRLVARGWPRPIPAAKAPGTIRVLGLSDSFGVVGGEANYHYLLEELFGARGLEVEVVNLSVAAYSPEQQLRMLRRWGERFEPDVVLHGFFVGNDFARPGPAQMSYRGIPVDRVAGLAAWYPQNLLSLQWLAQWRHVLADRRLRAAEGAQNPHGSFSRETFVRIERTRLSSCKRPKTDVEGWPHTTYLLDQIGDEARRLGAAHLIVVHPDQFQVEPALLAEIVDTYELDRSEYDLDLPQAYLRAYGSSRGTPLVDLTPHFRAAGGGGGLFLPLDTHYNPKGNRLAAGIIAEAMVPLLTRPETSERTQTGS